jgi:putative permease
MSPTRETQQDQVNKNRLMRSRPRRRRERLIRLFAVTTIVVSFLVVLLAVDHMLLSVVLALVSNYVMAPVVLQLERWRLPRQYAILLIFCGTGAAIGFAVYRLLPLLTQQLTAFETQLPRYQVDLMNLVSAAEYRFKGFFRLYNINFSEAINSWIINKTTELSAAIPAAISGSITVGILTPFFTFFMLQDGRRLTRGLLALVPNDLFEISLNLQHQLNEQFGGFIRARFLEAAIVGAVVWAGLEVIGFPYAGLLGVFAGATNLIPYLGPIIGAAPAILIALISEDAMISSSAGVSLAIVTGIYFLAQLIDIVFIIPLVVAKIVNLHPITVLIVIIIGAQVMGILGMVISIPVASAIKLICQTFYAHLTEIST